MANANIINVTDQNFSDEALNSELPVVVDFHAEWCGPCKMMAPDIEAIADEMAGKVKFAKLDIDHNNETASRYGITGVPTLIMFKEGKVVNQQIGRMTRPALKSFVESGI